MMPDSTMILGLGNPILGDDGIGCAVAESIRNIVGAVPGITVLSASVSMIRLVDEIAGYQRLIIIDSITTGQVEPGELREIEFKQNSSLPVSAHHFSIDQLQSIGDALGLSMPENVKVYGIEIIQPEEYGDRLSPALNRLLPELSEEIIRRELTSCIQQDSNTTSRGEFAV